MKTRREQLSKIMRQAWMLVKVYGFSMAEAMKQAWAISKLRTAMSNKVVKFLYKKLDGTTRTAWGTLQSSMLPEGKGTGRKPNESLVTYFDSEKQAYRSFKVANYVGMA